MIFEIKEIVETKEPISNKLTYTMKKVEQRNSVYE